jgi:Domain of unknown function DUF11
LGVTKTLGRIFVGTVMVWGIWLLGVPASAQGQVIFQTSADTNGGPPHQTYYQTIYIQNIGFEEATGVTVTFTPPKGLKVDSTCQVDHLPGGLRSYTCLVGNIAVGDTANVSFSISQTKAGDDSFTAEVTCDQGATASVWLWIDNGSL